MSQQQEPRVCWFFFPMAAGRCAAGGVIGAAAAARPTNLRGIMRRFEMCLAGHRYRRRRVPTLLKFFSLLTCSHSQSAGIDRGVLNPISISNIARVRLAAFSSATVQ
jgi:hypothetical protein